ncbi:hypothetical protein BPUN_3192 [Candidatus Paraburkholderia kirkii]|nr:hypothetical protein BPUN_3192 [Candidatus Paraburkholderia kirkii]
MTMTQLKRVAKWLKSLAAPSITPETEAVSSSEFTLAWHGDHWQNLLASPMDARHYVMEDWTTPLDNDIVPRETTVSISKP